MRKTPTKDALDPYRHVRIVQHKLKYPESSVVLDEWESKLLSIYKVRNSFKKKYPDTWSVEFAESYPLYFNLLSVYEDQGSGGDRDLVEAALLTSVDCDAIASGLHITKFSSLFLSMYRQLFYDVSRILGNGVSEFQYLVKPLLKADSDNIAVGAVWKILALIGGIPTLARKGFGTEALKAEDMAYLLQLAAFRNCSTLLKYAGKGLSMFEDNPAAASILSTLAEFDSVRGNGRRLDYFAEVSAVSKNNLSTLLSANLKLLNVPNDTLAKLAELDGAFHAGRENVIEYTGHVNFLDSDKEVDSED